MQAYLAKETCFVTAATGRFVPGTLVTLVSFRQHHPGFDGDALQVRHRKAAR